MLPHLITTVRIPRSLALKLSKHVSRKKKVVRRYSRNDAIVAAVQQLVDQSEGGPSNSPESAK